MKSFASSLSVFLLCAVGIMIHSGCVTSSDIIQHRIALSGWIMNPGMYNIRDANTLCMADIIKVAGGLNHSAQSIQAVVLGEEGEAMLPIALLKSDQWHTSFKKLGIDMRRCRTIEFKGRMIP